MSGEPALILALNCGSSSLKFGVFSCSSPDALQLVLEGEAEEIGNDEGVFWTRAAQEPPHRERHTIADHETALHVAWHAMEKAGCSAVSAIGHRLVHGGPDLREHTLLTAAVRNQLNQAEAFAPLHLPSALAVVDAASEMLSGVPTVVCLDTAFHRDLPALAKTLPVPAAIREQGIERYGFHGLSLEAITGQRPDLPPRTVIAHLGNGSSVNALLNGKSMDTTMGVTPCGGVMMGTRSGDLDPGVLLYLLRHGFDGDSLEHLLDRRSGLLGVSGKSGDVRRLRSLSADDANCELALNMFAYQVKKAIAAMAAALGGLDLLIFTGGIGEHDEQLRAEITAGLSWMGSFRTEVLAAQEDLQIARITRRLLSL